MRSYLLSFVHVVHVMVIANMASISLGNIELSENDHIRNGSSPGEYIIPYANRNMRLLVRNIPETRMIQQLPPALSVTKGTRLVLECQAVGYPIPKMRLITLRDIDRFARTDSVPEKGVMNIGIVSSKLVINCADERHHNLRITYVSKSGDPRVITNTAGTILQNLEVIGNGSHNNCTGEEKPAIIFHAIAIFANVSNTVILPCKFIGNPTPKLYWFDAENRNLTSNDRYTILSDGSLKIINLQSSDMGSYTCVVRSNTTEDYASTSLYPLLSVKNNKTSREVTISLEKSDDRVMQYLSVVLPIIPPAPIRSTKDILKSKLQAAFCVLERLEPEKQEFYETLPENEKELIMNICNSVLSLRGSKIRV